MNDSIASKSERNELFQFIAAHFDEGELPELCLSLGVDLSDIKGGSHRERALGLVEFMSRRGRFKELREAAYEARPDVPKDEDTTREKRGSTVAVYEERRPAEPSQEPVKPDEPPRKGCRLELSLVLGVIVVVAIGAFSLIRDNLLSGVTATPTVSLVTGITPTPTAITATPHSTPTATLSPTATATFTPTASPTPTVTTSPTTTPVSPFVEIFPQIEDGVEYWFSSTEDDSKFRFEIKTDPGCARSGAYGVELYWNMAGDEFSGWGINWVETPDGYFDTSGFAELVFWVKGAQGNEDFHLALSDSTTEEVAEVSSEDLLPVSAADWVEIRIPFDGFPNNSFSGGEIDNITHLEFAFYASDGRGTMCVDDIAFTLQE